MMVWFCGVLARLYGWDVVALEMAAESLGRTA